MRQVFKTICYLIVIIVNIAFTGDTVESDGVLETVTDEVHSVEDYQYVLGYKNMNIPEQEKVVKIEIPSQNFKANTSK